MLNKNRLSVYALLLLLASLLMGANVAKAQEITVTLTTDIDRVLRSTGGHPLSFTVRATFSEAINDLSLGQQPAQVAARNLQFLYFGTAIDASTFVKESDSAYTILLAPKTGDKPFVEIQFAAGKATARSGTRVNTRASNILRIPFNTAPTGGPTLTLAGVPTNVNSQDEFDVTLTANEVVSLVNPATPIVIVDNGAFTLERDMGGTVYTISITPNGEGDIGITIPDNVIKGGNDDGNAALPTQIVRYIFPDSTDSTVPTVAITGPSDVGPTPFTVTVTVTVTGDVGPVSFAPGAIGNIEVTNGEADNPESAVNSGTGVYTILITPDSNITPDSDDVSRITVVIPAGTFMDNVGSLNEGETTHIAVYDPTLDSSTTSTLPLPAVVVPRSVDNLEEFDVTITFSEVVTFISSASSNFEVSNGSVTGFEATNGSSTGTSLSSKASLGSTTHLSSTAFKLSITPDGNGDIKAAILPNSFTDSTDKLNARIELFTVPFVPDTAATEVVITDFILNRSSHLASNQPGLTHILQGDSATLSGAANGTDSSGKVVGRMSHAHGGTGTWGEINSAWSDEDSNDSSYTLVTLGGHGYVQPNTIVGGMIQLDLADDDALNITGKGWLSGPYFVHKLNEQNVYFEGRLLYGQTENEISPSNAYTDSFDSDRYLAQFRITGEYGYQTATIMPLLDFTYTEDTQQAYTDSLRRLIEEQSVDLTQMTFGIDFKLPIAMQRGSLDFTSGLSGIYSQVNGGNGGKSESNIKGGRGRMELGLNYHHGNESGNGNGLTLTATTFYDGISSDYESYGVNFSVGMEF